MISAEPKTKADAILDAAGLLFLRFGFKRTSIEDIAREAGIAKGTVYLYFDSKEAIFRAMTTRKIGQLERLCDETEARGGDFETRLLALLNAQYSTLYTLKFAGSEHLIELGMTTMMLSADIMAAAQESYATRLTRVITAAVKQGEISLAAAKIKADALANLIIAGANTRGATGAPLSAEEHQARLKSLVRVVVAAVRA